MLNHRDRSYTVLDKAAIQSLASQMNQGTNQLQDALRNATPEQRAAMQQLLGNQLPGAVGAGLAGASAADHGSCHRVRLYGHAVRNLARWPRKSARCTSPIGRTSTAAATWRRHLSTWAAFAQELVAALPGGNTGPAAQMDSDIFSVMNQIDGFPIGVRQYRPDGSVEQEWALRSAKRQRVDPATFSPPGGYRRVAMAGS